jgi:hypothetical protein
LEAKVTVGQVLIVDKEDSVAEAGLAGDKEAEFTVDEVERNVPFCTGSS